jgi:hypothetical protein
VKFPAQFRAVLQALLISAVMLAPVWGQIHKTVHGIKATAVSEQSLFSDHQEGSLVCFALDHLASDDGLQTAATSPEFVQPFVSVVASQSAHHDEAQTLAFSARAPPQSL